MISIKSRVLGAMRARAGSQGRMSSTTAIQWVRCARTRVANAMPVLGKILGSPDKSTGGKDDAVFMPEVFVRDPPTLLAKICRLFKSPIAIYSYAETEL